MSQIKFVYFDIGDVVFNWKQVLNEIATISNKTYDDVHQVFKKYDDDVCRAKISPQELWQHFKTELGIDQEIENFIEWWVSSFTPIFPMHQLVQEIANKYKVGILTNIYPGAWKYYVANGLIPDVSYVSIIRSCDLGFVKPEDAIYKYAEERAGFPASEILLIDNSQRNIDKAKELDWQTVRYDVNDPQKSRAEIRNTLKLD